MKIPYFADKILSSKELNITLKGLAIGDGTIGNYAAMFDVPVSTYMHQQSKRLGLPQDILNVFSEADQRCGFTQVLDQLTYPPKGLIQVPGNPEGENFRRRKRQASGASNCNFNLTSAVGVQQSIFAACNGGCATYSTAVNYLTQKNPWYATPIRFLTSKPPHLLSLFKPATLTVLPHSSFSVYNIAATCPSANPNTTFPATTYLNLPAVRTAIHAANKTWEVCNATILDTLSSELVMPPAYNILPRLLGKGVCVHLYSGDQDFLLDHIGTELVVQNMTWYVIFVISLLQGLAMAVRVRLSLGRRCRD